MPTPRLNVSLINDDGDKLEQLRSHLEQRTNKRLSLAEVVRIAIDHALIVEVNLKHDAYYTLADCFPDTK